MPSQDEVEKARLEERERCARIVESEPELPGPMPDELRGRFEAMGMEEAHRCTVRVTKNNIARRIREGS